MCSSTLEIDFVSSSWLAAFSSNSTKYEWIFTAPPDFNNQIVLTKQDTIYYRFRTKGDVFITVRYKEKNEDWSNDLIKNLNIK